MPNDSRSIAGAIADLRRRMADQDRMEAALSNASATPTVNTIVKSGTAGTTIDAGWIPLLGTAQIPILDHGINLTGLTDDDHTQYLLASGTRALSGNWAAGQTRNVTVGTIGIGTTTPAYPLHVIGTARADTVFASTVTATTLSGTTFSGTSVTGSTVSATTLLVTGNPLTVGGTSSITGTAVVTTGDQTIAGVKSFSGSVAGTVNATLLQQNGNTLTVAGASNINGTVAGHMSGGGTVATGGYVLTVAGASSLNGTVAGHMSGGGTVATGGFGLTVPATGTAVLNTSNQTVAGVKTFSEEMIDSTFIRFTTDAGTISGGALTATATHMTVDTEGTAATDDLDTINGHQIGRLLILRTLSGTRDVTVKDGTGNLRLAGDFTLANQTQTIMLIGGPSTTWLEIARSAN